MVIKEGPGDAFALGEVLAVAKAAAHAAGDLIRRAWAEVPPAPLLASSPPTQAVTARVREEG